MKNGQVRFQLNRNAAKELARAAGAKRLVEDVASGAAKNAKRLAPRASGRLADSIDSKADLTSDGWTGVVFFTAWYGKLWEFGHRGREKPFLRPGTQQAISRVGGRWKSD